MRLMYCKNCKAKPKPLAFCGGVAIRHHCYREFIEDTEAEVINAWNKDNSPVESAKLVGNNDKKASDNNRSDEISLIQSAIEDIEGCAEYESPGESTVGKLNAAIAKLRTCG